MDVRVVLFLIITHLWTVHSLKCKRCIPNASLNCTDTDVDCPAGQCVSLGVTTYTEGLKVNHINMRFCLASGHCPTGSINYGTAVSSFKSKCCGANLCNAHEMPDVVPDSSKNGLKCFTCEGQNCTSTLDCLGDENRCIKTKVTTEEHRKILKGCASENLCETSQSQVLLPNIYTSSVCCEGALCNHAKRSSLGLFLFLMALSSIILTL